MFLTHSINFLASCAMFAAKIAIYEQRNLHNQRAAFCCSNRFRFELSTRCCAVLRTAAV